MAKLLNIGWGIAYVQDGKRHYLCIVNDTDADETADDFLKARKVPVPTRDRARQRAFDDGISLRELLLTTVEGYLN